jgi:hypothetical protein
MPRHNTEDGQTNCRIELAQKANDLLVVTRRDKAVNPSFSASRGDMMITAR